MEKEFLEKITVLIPMYNAAATVEKCIRSVLRQSYTNLEIVVVDDGSKDDSYKIVKNLAKTDARIRLLQKENEKSLAKTRQFLINQVRTKYFVFVDSDDIVKKKYVEHLYDAMVKYDADCVASSFKINGKIPFTGLFTRKKVVEKEEIVSTFILSKNIHFVVWNKIFKTDIVKSLDVDPRINYGEDFVLCYEYFKKCNKVVFINKYDYKYLLNKNSMIHKKFSKQNIDFLDWLEKTAELETVPADKRALNAWIAFTSASFKYMMKESKYKDEELTNRLNANIEKYNNDFVKNKYTSTIFRIAYKFTKGIK